MDSMFLEMVAFRYGFPQLCQILFYYQSVRAKEGTKRNLICFIRLLVSVLLLRLLLLHVSGIATLWPFEDSNLLLIYKESQAKLQRYNIKAPLSVFSLIFSVTSMISILGFLSLILSTTIGI